MAIYANAVIVNPPKEGAARLCMENGLGTQPVRTAVTPADSKTPATTASAVPSDDIKE